MCVCIFIYIYVYNYNVGVHKHCRQCRKLTSKFKKASMSRRITTTALRK